MKNAILPLLLAVLAYMIWYVFFKKHTKSTEIQPEKEIKILNEKSRLFRQKYRAEDFAENLRLKGDVLNVLVAPDTNDKRKSRVTWTKT